MGGGVGRHRVGASCRADPCGGGRAWVSRICGATSTPGCASYAAGEVDAALLAAAGLARLGIEPANARVLALDEIVPAPAGRSGWAGPDREGDRERLDIWSSTTAVIVLDADRVIANWGRVRASAGGDRSGERKRGAPGRLRRGARRRAKVVRATASSEDPGHAAHLALADLQRDGADRILDAVRAR